MQQVSIKRARSLIGLAVFAVLAAATASAQNLGKADFQEALVGAMTDRNLRNVTLQGEQLKMQELPNVSPQGAFRVNLISVCQMLGTANSTSNQAGKVMRYQNGSVFANMGTNMQFAVNSQVVQAHQRERVEKALAERLESLNGEYGDLKAQLQRLDDGAYQLVAQHTYGSSPSAGNVRSRLAATIGHARFMICDIHTAMELADHERWKALRNTKLGQMDRATFITLYPLLKEPGYEAKDGEPGGAWRFKISDEVRPRVENAGTELRVWVFTKPPAPPDAARWGAIAANIQALRPSHGAASILFQQPNEQGFIWAALVFPYAQMTGDEFADTMKKLIDKEGVVDFHKRLVGAVRAAY